MAYRSDIFFFDEQNSMHGCTICQNKGLFVKNVRSQGKGVIECGDLADKREGFFRCGVRTFWCKKIRIFRNWWCVRTEKGEGCWIRADIMRTRSGQIVHDFVRTSFMDGPNDK